MFDNFNLQRKFSLSGRRSVTILDGKSVKEDSDKLSDEVDGDGISSQKKDTKEKENEDQQSTDNEDPSGIPVCVKYKV